MADPSGVSRAVRDLLGDSRFTAVDFGARGGVPKEWSALGSAAMVVCVEGDPQEAKRLQAELRAQPATANWVVASELVTGTGGRRTLYVTNSRSGSSLFDPRGGAIPQYTDAGYLFPIEVTEVETRRASEVLRSLGEPEVHFAKLDIQGCELEVLRDLAASGVARLSGVAIEMAVQDKGPGHPRFEDVHPYLSSQQFELFDLGPVRVHRAYRGSRADYARRVFASAGGRSALSPRLWELDGLYFRTIESVVTSSAPAADLRRLVVSYGLYGFFAEAHDAVERASLAGVVSQAEGGTLAEAIVRWHREVACRRSDGGLFGRLRRRWTTIRG